MTIDPEITTTNEEAQLHGIKALIYGLSGAGKTRLAATCKNPLILSAESGLLSLKNYSLPVIKISSLNDLYNTYDWLIKGNKALYDTIYLDSISEIGEVVLANAKESSKDNRAVYGTLIDEMKTILKMFRNLENINVVMSAKQELNKDEITGITTYGPSMPGAKLSPQLPYLFDEVFRISIGKTQTGELYRFIQTSQDLQYIAKDRSGVLDFMEKPDLDYIFNKILGNQNGQA